MIIVTKRTAIDSDNEYEVAATEYLNIARLCESYHVLPSSGGLLDQDAQLIHFLVKISEYDALRQEFDDQQAKQRSQM